MNKNAMKKILILILTLASIFCLITCTFQIRTTESAVLTTFEKPIATIDKPGLHFKMPWPIQSAYIFDKRTRIYQSPFTEYLIKDGYNIITRVFTCWAIDNAQIYKNRVGVTVSSGEQILATLISKYLRNTLNEKSLSEIIGTNHIVAANEDIAKQPAESGITQLEISILQRIQNEATSEYGIKVSFFGFDRLELPEDTTKSVFDRMKSERMTMVNKIQYEGEYSARTIKTEADLESSKIISQAEAEAVKIKGEAETKAFEYLDIYNKNPQFALFLKKLQALEEAMKSKTTVVIDKKTPPFNMLEGNPENLINKNTNELK